MRRILSALMLIAAVSAPIPAQADPGVEKIGATLALTGKLAYLGLAEKRGFELAIADLNADRAAVYGSAPRFVFVAEDNTGDPKTAVTSIQKMLDADKIEVLFSAFTHVTTALAPVVARSEAVLVYASSSREIAKAGPRIFRDNFDAEDGGELLGKMIAQAQPASVAILTENSEVCSIALGSMRPKLEQLGIPIKDTVEFNSGEPDFKPLLLRLRAAGAAALAVCAWRDEASLMPQMAAMNMLTVPGYHFFAPFLPAADTEEMHKLFAKNNTFSTWYGFTDPPADPAVAAWVERFKSAYGEKPRPDSLFSYEDMMFIGTGIRICRKNGADVPPCLANYLQQATYPGISGPLKFDGHRLINRQIFPIRFKDGVWTPINTVAFH